MKKNITIFTFLLIFTFFVFCKEDKNTENKEKKKNLSLISLFITTQKNIQANAQCTPTYIGSGSKFSSASIDTDVYSIVNQNNNCNLDSDCAYEKILPIIGQLCAYCSGESSFTINVKNIVQIKKEFEEKNHNTCVTQCGKSPSFFGCPIASTLPPSIVYTNFQIKCNSSKKCERIGVN